MHAQLEPSIIGLDLMKRITLLLLGLAFLTTASHGQTFKGRSEIINLDYGYPDLIINRELSFNDQNNNRSVDPGETATIGFFIDNTGLYPAQNVVVKARDNNHTPGLILKKEHLVGNIPRSQRDVLVQNVIRGDSVLEAGLAKLVFDVYENNKLIDSLSIDIATTGLIEGRNLEMLDHLFFADNRKLMPGKWFRVKLSVKNKGSEVVKDVSFDFEAVPHLLEQFRRKEMVIPEMQPGEIRELSFDFTLGINFSEPSLVLNVTIQGSNEKEGTQETIMETVHFP